MAYKDLTPTTAIEYVKKHTTIFPAQAQLEVYEIGAGEDDGDGFVNHLYRLWDQEGRSVILKQAKPYLKIYGACAPLTTKRNHTEAEIIKLRQAITPEYLPEMYHIDRENNLFVYEDCGRLKIMRFELTKGKSFPLFPQQMGEFLAKSNFYTSEIYLDQIAHKALEVKFMNPEMRRIMESILFLRDSFMEEADLPTMSDPDPNHVIMSDLFWGKKEIRVELLKLRGIFMRKSECLVHGDLHTSNIMIDETEMKIIDMEYPFMGPASADAGYLMGNLIYGYIAWHYHQEGSEAFRKNYRAEMLAYIRGIYREYVRVFTAAWDKDAKAIYRDYSEYRDHLLRNHLKEACGFAGCQIVSRVSSYVSLPDFDALLDEASRNDARRLALLIADSLIMKRDQVETIDDFIKIIKGVTKQYLAVMKVIRK